MPYDTDEQCKECGQELYRCSDCGCIACTNEKCDLFMYCVGSHEERKPECESCCMTH